MKGQAIKRAEPDGVSVLEGEAIIDICPTKGTLELFAKWLGYNDLESTWDSLEKIMNAWELV